MPQLDSHFDNFVSAATNSNFALKQLAAVTADQYAKMKSPLDALSATPRNPAPAPGTRFSTVTLPLTKKRKLDKWIKTLHSSVKNS